MDLGAISSTNTDWYTTALAKYGQGPLAPLGASNNSTSTMSTTAANTVSASTNYTPSASVEQALQTASANLVADYSNVFETSKKPTSANGFLPAVNLNANLALAAYADKLNGIPTSSSDAPQASSNQSAIQAAQASMLASTMNLVG
jgi:hypothetical protein